MFAPAKPGERLPLKVTGLLLLTVPLGQLCVSDVLPWTGARTGGEPSGSSDTWSSPRSGWLSPNVAGICALPSEPTNALPITWPSRRRLTVWPERLAGTLTLTKYGGGGPPPPRGPPPAGRGLAPAREK